MVMLDSYKSKSKDKEITRQTKSVASKKEVNWYILYIEKVNSRSYTSPNLYAFDI